MPVLVPIENLQWVTKIVKPRMIKMYGAHVPYSLMKIIQSKIMPEHVAKSQYPVEFMLACLQEGAWLVGYDWRTYSRYAVAKRLRVHYNKIFKGPFEVVAQDFLDYQLNHGTFSARDRLAQFATRHYIALNASSHSKAVAKLMLSVTDEVMENAVIQPYHWIRVLVALSDPNPTMGLALMQREMYHQKVTLCVMLRAKE